MTNAVRRAGRGCGGQGGPSQLRAAFPEEVMAEVTRRRSLWWEKSCQPEEQPVQRPQVMARVMDPGAGRGGQRAQVVMGPGGRRAHTNLHPKGLGKP